jgi:hypothetical protein
MDQCALFLITVLALVVYLNISRADQIEATEGEGGGTVKDRLGALGVEAILWSTLRCY